MTDKCWFVLRHTHHATPLIPASGYGKATGPVCIGHVITSTKSLDIVNPAGPEEYPSSIRIQAGVAYDLDWKLTEGGTFDLSSKVAAPIAAAAGADVGFNAGVAFKHSVNRCWEFERLETSYVNMTQSYLDDTMDSPEVESYVKRNKQYGVVNPSLFVITGIMIGRKAKLSETETKERGGNLPDLCLKTRMLTTANF